MTDYSYNNKLYNTVLYNNTKVFDQYQYLDKVAKHLNAENLGYVELFEEKNKVYSTIKENIISNGLETHIVDGVAIPLNPTWKKIAVNLSGGADSAILTYILAKTIQEKKYNCTIDIITYKRCWKTRPWQEDIGLQVYNCLKNKFPDIICDRETAYIPPEMEHGAIGNVINNRSTDQIMIASFNDYLSFKNNYNACYNATTKNPSVDFEIKDRMTNRDNVKHNLGTIAYIKDNSLSWSLEPLRLIEKDWIVRQYKNHNLLDLFAKTRSCEGDSYNSKLLGIDYINYRYNKPDVINECGSCFWCIERKWAKEQVGIE